MRTADTWVCVADGMRASFYRCDGPGQALQPMMDCAIRGTPGDAFAGRVAERLDKAAVACLYEHLVLVGPEPVLGALRGRLSADTAAKVVSEVARDLGHVTPRELGCHLGPVLPH